MTSLVYLHITSFIVIYFNYLIFNRSLSNDLASKYFLTNYIFHNHKLIRYFIVYYPFFIIATYFIYEGVVLIATSFISVLYLYFLDELTSRKNIETKEQYIDWYTHNVEHSLSIHEYDILKKNFNFLYEKVNRFILFKFEIIFFITLVIESESVYEIFTFLGKI